MDRTNPMRDRLNPTVFLLTVSLLTVGLAPVSAQTAASTDEIVAKSLEALGGSRWQDLEGLQFRGTFTTFSSPQPFTLTRQRPNLYRFDHFEADQPITIAFDGDRAWWQNPWIPFSEVPWPTAPPLVYTRGFEADAPFDFPFLDAESQGNTVELVGRTDFEGLDTWELAVVLANGSEERWYLDAESHLPVARSGRAGYTGFEAQRVVFFSDYREVEGVMVPFYWEEELGNRFGELEVEEVTLDPEVSPTHFQFPLPPVLTRLAGAIGEWTVEAETRPMPNLPWIPSTGTATFRSILGGQAVEETLDLVVHGKPRQIRRIYTYDRFRDALRIVHLDDLSAHPILLSGTPSPEGSLQADNRSTDTHWEMMGMPLHHRWSLDDLGGDSIRGIWESSPNGGEMWLPSARLVYHRQTP